MARDVSTLQTSNLSTYPPSIKHSHSIQRSLERLGKQASTILTQHETYRGIHSNTSQATPMNRQAELSPSEIIERHRLRNEDNRVEYDYRAPNLKDLIHDVDKEIEQVRLNRLVQESAYKLHKNQISERFNPRFKSINSKLDRIDHISYVHSLEKKNLTDVTTRLRELHILKMERKYRAFDI